MSRCLAALLFVALTPPSNAQSWPQWGADAQHRSATPVIARRIDRIEQEITIDPLASTMQSLAGGDLLAHYPVPLVDGNDVITIRKSGTLMSLGQRATEVWSVVDMRRSGGQLVTRWVYTSDWKPVPYGSASWEPVYHPLMTRNAVWAPGAGGTIDQLDRETGALVRRFNPFGANVDATIFVSGPPVADSAGNVYYNAIQLDPELPWTKDPRGSWLVRIAADNTIRTATFASLVRNAPAADAQCTWIFEITDLPWPPAPDAVPPSIRCGAQRPGINAAPAVAPDGTIYTISRAHLNLRWGYLVAVNRDLTPKWTASLRNRFYDGCDVTVPPSGTPGGCREGSTFGVDPYDNQPGTGMVSDDSTSSPAVAPDGRVFYGSYTRYNYAEGHLMVFGPDGKYIGAYGWGWDLTPAIYQHNSTYSLLLKENHYALGSYCNDPVYCPYDRTGNAPSDPEEYFITQLSSSLAPEWKFKSTNTQSCSRQSDGTLQCDDDTPNGFEWCVNAIAVDGRGVAYANSEDGNLYAIAQGGRLEQQIFLRLAVGAAYTPTSIGPDGRIYTQNDGDLFILNQNPKRRAASPK